MRECRPAGAEERGVAIAIVAGLLRHPAQLRCVGFKPAGRLGARRSFLPSFPAEAPAGARRGVCEGLLVSGEREGVAARPSAGPARGAHGQGGDTSGVLDPEAGGTFLSAPRRGVGAAVRPWQPRAAPRSGGRAWGRGWCGAAASRRSLVPERGRHFEWWRRGRRRSQESGLRRRGSPGTGLRLTRAETGRLLRGGDVAAGHGGELGGSRGLKAGGLGGRGGAALGRRGKWRRGASGGSRPRFRR